MRYFDGMDEEFAWVVIRGDEVVVRVCVVASTPRFTWYEFPVLKVAFCEAVDVVAVALVSYAY